MSDQKMKDLMRRMTEMSPEPPQFPDDVPTVQPVRPQRSGAWVFAVAGLAVVALALPFMFWQGDRVAAPTETSVPEVPPTTGLPIAGRPSAVFLVQNVDSSYLGNPAIVSSSTDIDWDALDAAARTMASSELRLLTNLDLLGVTLPDGLFSVIPSGVEVLSESHELVNGEWIAVFDMNEEFRAGAGGALADFTMLNQLVYTATQNQPSGRVRFTIAGEPVDDFGMEGLSLIDPVDRDSFIEHLNPIMITEPPTVDTAGVLTVRGRANVFEATLNYHFDHEHSDVIGHVTATCGTGCWGEFEITIDVTSDLYDDAPLLVFSQSGEDGWSPLHVVSIPRSLWVRD